MATTFTLRPKKVGILLLILAITMSVLAVIGDSLELKFDRPTAQDEGNTHIWPIARQFSFVEEGNLANFNQSLPLALALIFFFLGADEVAQIDRTTIANTISAIRRHESDKTGWFWIYLPALAVFGAAFVPFLRHLPGRIAVLFMVSGAIYVNGVVVMEKVVNWFAGKYGDDTFGYVLIDNLSEFMEAQASPCLFTHRSPISRREGRRSGSAWERRASMPMIAPTLANHKTARCLQSGQGGNFHVSMKRARAIRPVDPCFLMPKTSLFKDTKLA